MPESDHRSASALERIFPGDSEMAARLRTFDWAHSDLGPPATWPENLRIALSLCLTSRFPILLWWGPQLTVLYNDAYIPFLGETKHPQALARPGQTVWPEIWDTIGPLLQSVRATGQVTGSADFLFFVACTLPQEEVYARFTNGPILAGDGRTVEGIFTPCTETTEHVISARRLETLRRLAVGAAEARTVAAACQAAAVVLAENPRDMPFAAVYVLDEQGTQATLAATAGLIAGSSLLPAAVALTSDDSSPWPLAAVRHTQRPEAVDLAGLSQALPGGPWPDPARTALVLPIMATHANLAGLLIAGVSSRQPLDAPYRTFFDLVAANISTAIAYAHATAGVPADAPSARWQAGAAAGPAGGETAEASGAQARVLVADDNVDMRAYLQRLLAGQYAILAVADGEAALAAVRAHQPDLVIADVMMPRLDGFALLRQLRADPRTSSMAVILLSARAGEEARRAGLAAGADDYLTKPFSARELLARVEGTLALVRLRRAAGRREEELRAEVVNVLESIAEGFMVFDTEWRIIYFNPVAERESRTPRAEVLGRNYWEAFPLVLGTPLEHQFRRVMADRVPQRLVNYYEPFDSWFEMIISPVRDGGITVQGRDITARKRAEEAVRQSEARFRALFENSHDAILIADDNSVYVHANPAAAELFGVSAEQLIGKNIYDFVATEQGPHTDRLWRQFIEAGFQQGEFEIRRPDGEQRNLEYSAVANILPGQHLSTMRDITERKRAEEVLLDLRKQLAADLTTMRRLHELSMQVVSTGELADVYPAILGAVMELQNADFGNIQIYDPESRDLRIVAQCGFQQEFLDYFRIVRIDDSSACARALKAGERVIVADVETDAEYAPHRQVAASAGYRAVQSTPMHARNGEPLGMISTHFRAPHRPAERELRLTDLFVHLAAETIKRKRAEAALRESEERFRSYFELGLIGMAITSSTTSILEVNDEICKILGYERDELLQMTWAAMTHPDDLASDVALFDRVMAGEIDGYSIDKRWIRKDGGIIDSNVSVKCVRRADKSVDYFVALLQEITERKRAEEARRASEARLRSLVAQVPAILWTTDRNLVMTSSVGAGLAAVGLQPNEVVDVSLYQYLQTDDPMSVPIAAHLRALAGEANSYEWEEAGVVFQTYVEPFRDEAGQIVGTIGTGLDITARKQAEEALRESEARFRAVVDLVPDLLWSRDAQGAEWYNRRWTEYTRQSSEQAAGFGWLDVIHPDDRPESLARFEWALRTGQPLRHEHRIRGTDGAYRWFLLQARPLQDMHGQITHWFAAATDIQDQRLARHELEERVRQRSTALGAANVALQAQMVARQSAESELRQSNARLRALSERLLGVQEDERRTIARELHDEVGQYLTALRFTLEALGMASTIPPAPRLANALALVDDLTARVRELSLGLRPSMLDDAGLLPALLWHIERYTRQTGIEVILGHQGLETRLPAPVETAVYRIVQEALTNVARHAATQQAHVQILADGLVTVLIEDAGQGFDVDAALARHDSTGLSGMRERAELLGGQLLIESPPGGTRVLAEIPLDAVQ